MLNQAQFLLLISLLLLAFFKISTLAEFNNSLQKFSYEYEVLLPKLNNTEKCGSQVHNHRRQNLRPKRRSRYLDYSTYVREAEEIQENHPTPNHRNFIVDPNFAQSEVLDERPRIRRGRSRYQTFVQHDVNSETETTLNHNRRNHNRRNHHRPHKNRRIDSNTINRHQTDHQQSVPLHESVRKYVSQGRTSGKPVNFSNASNDFAQQQTQSRSNATFNRRHNGRSYSSTYPYNQQNLGMWQAYYQKYYQHAYPQSSYQANYQQPHYQQPSYPHHTPPSYTGNLNIYTDDKEKPQTPKVQEIKEPEPPIDQTFESSRIANRRPPAKPKEEEEEVEEQRAPEPERSSHESGDLKVGKSINVFSRYGFLTLSIKVASPQGESDFLFRENTAEIFEKNSYWGKREARHHSGDFDDHFYIHFCENLHELLIAYFDHFSIEGVPKPHKAFTSSLSIRALARQFGVNASFLNGHFSFVLVRLFRRNRRSTLKGPLELSGDVKEALQSVKVGDEESVHQFIDSYGSHVITEYEVGDMMYQTFVFGEALYRQLKNKFAVVTNESHLEELQQFFTPNYAANVGNVLLASGIQKFEDIMDSRLVTPELLLYPNIFKVFDSELLENELEELNGEVILSLKLEKISNKLPPSAKTRWMSEVLDNSLAVYYHHMSSTRKNT